MDSPGATDPFFGWFTAARFVTLTLSKNPGIRARPITTPFRAIIVADIYCLLSVFDFHAAVTSISGIGSTSSIVILTGFIALSSFSKASSQVVPE